MWNRESIRAFATALCLAMPVAAGAEPAGQSVEVWGAFSGVIDAPSGSLTSSYEPPLLYVAPSDGSGQAGQTLTLNGARHAGFQAGVNLFPTPHVGLQVLVDRAAVPLGGANGPYDVSLTYVSRQPPNYTPQTFTTSSSTPWPDTRGSLDQLTVAANLVARTPALGPVRATVSGGVSYYRLAGSAEALGYTEFRMGGHSVLFSDENQMAVAFDPTHAFGFNIGGDVSVTISRHLAALVGYRYLGAGDTAVPVHATAILNATQVATSETVDQIDQRMQLAPARVRLASSRLIVGVKVTP